MADNRMIANLLNCRVAVYAPMNGVNALGEQTITHEQVSRVWAGISVKRGAETKEAGNTVAVEFTHSVLLRTNAVPNLCREMFFTYAGNRYDIVYVQPYYRDRGLVECLCRLVVEE